MNENWVHGHFYMSVNILRYIFTQYSARERTPVMISRVASYRPAFWKWKNIVRAIKFGPPSQTPMQSWDLIAMVLSKSLLPCQNSFEYAFAPNVPIGAFWTTWLSVWIGIRTTNNSGIRNMSERELTWVSSGTFFEFEIPHGNILTFINGTQ